MLARICKHLRSIEYLDVTLSGNVVSGIKFLPMGQLLRENIARERGPDQIVREQSFDFKSFPTNYLTNSVAHLKRKNPLEVLRAVNFQSTTAEESPRIELKASKVLCSTSLVSPKHAFELFFQLQRQRKIWWMKFMYNPGQIVFTNPTRTESSQTISISMKSGEGFNVELERIGLYPVGDSMKSHALQSWFSLDASVFSFLVDALPEVAANDLTLHLHRRLSPYKIVLLAEDQLSSDLELRDLAQLVNYEFLSRDLNVLNGFEGNRTLTENLSRADQMGIPYSLILGSESLTTGLFKLRNRNTSLCEVVHITDIPGYVEKIIQG